MRTTPRPRRRRMAVDERDEATSSDYGPGSTDDAQPADMLPTSDEEAFVPPANRMLFPPASAQQEEPADTTAVFGSVTAKPFSWFDTVMGR